MKSIFIYLSVAIFSLSFQPLKAQEESTQTEKTQEESKKAKIERLEAEKEEIISEEKEALKRKVAAIQDRLENKRLSSEEASLLKKQAAKEHALNIENRVAIIENQIALLSREDSAEADDPWANDRWGKDGEDGDSSYVFNWNSEKKERKYDRRTYTDLVVAFGFNNAIEEGQSVNDLDFKIAGSRFFELGLAWKTRVFKNSNWLRLKYGFSFQFNGLKPTGNRYFVEEDNMTRLVEHELDLDKSKFRMDNLVFPIHFEIGPSSRTETEHRLRFSTEDKLKIGFGGYAGVNLGERQKLKYEKDGEDVKQKLKNDYNTNEFVYGLSAYLGWGGTAAYVKYDLNPIFQEPNVELRNVSVGLRFDMD